MDTYHISIRTHVGPPFIGVNIEFHIDDDYMYMYTYIARLCSQRVDETCFKSGLFS